GVPAGRLGGRARGFRRVAPARPRPGATAAQPAGGGHAVAWRGPRDAAAGTGLPGLRAPDPASAGLRPARARAARAAGLDVPEPRLPADGRPGMDGGLRVPPRRSRPARAGP